MKTNIELVEDLHRFYITLEREEPEVTLRKLESIAHSREDLLDLWHEVQLNCLHGMSLIPS